MAEDPAENAADLAERLLTSDDVTLAAPVTVLAHRPGAELIERREALRPLYNAVVRRIGRPALLGGHETGPSVRWHRPGRTLLLSGDHSQAHLSAHDAERFAETEWWDFDGWDPSRSAPMPYTWQLDRRRPVPYQAWTYNGQQVALDWAAARRQLELMLASWAEHMPVQAPGDWVGFQLRVSRDWNRDMLVAYEPARHGGEFVAMVDDRDHGPTPEHEERMRARGWQFRETGWWRLSLPETDPRAPARLTAVILADMKARGATGPAEATAFKISAGDDGDLWLPGIGINTYPPRGEHY